MVSIKNSLFTPPATASAPGTIGPIALADKLSVYSLWMAPIFADNMTVAFKVTRLLSSRGIPIRNQQFIMDDAELRKAICRYSPSEFVAVQWRFACMKMTHEAGLCCGQNSKAAHPLCAVD